MNLVNLHAEVNLESYHGTNLYINIILLMKSYNDSIHNLIYNVDASHLINNEKTEVFFPNNRNEVIEVVEKAIENNNKIVCRAWWTNLVWNCLPGKNTIVVDLSALNKILEQNVNNIVVEPWLTTDELNAILDKYDLYFPVQLWSHSAAQIGGMIATNWAWMRAIKYWKMENWVDEIEVLTINDNKEIKIQTLSWDKAKDFFWAEWNLGIILNAKLKLIKKPESSSINFKSFENLDSALDYVKWIKSNNNSDLSALEIINPQVAQTIWLENKYYILVEYENQKDWDISDKNEIKSIREKRDACYASTVNSGYPQIEDPEIHNHKEELFQRCEKNNIPVYGHIWIWVLHPHFNNEQKELMDEMYKLVQKLWWNVSGEHGIGRKKQKYLSDEEKNQIKKIKEKRDSNDIFWF